MRPGHVSYDPWKHVRCECGHLFRQHGPDPYPAAREGCWWCDCGQEKAA